MSWPDYEAAAKVGHETYERLAPSFGYKTRIESAIPWEYVPAPLADLMVAAYKAGVVAALGNKVIYEKPTSPPDMSPSMGGPNYGRWHDATSVQSFIRKAVESGWLVQVWPEVNDE